MFKKYINNNNTFIKYDSAFSIEIVTHYVTRLANKNLILK